MGALGLADPFPLLIQSFCDGKKGDEPAYSAKSRMLPQPSPPLTWLVGRQRVAMATRSKKQHEYVKEVQ